MNFIIKAVLFQTNKNSEKAHLYRHLPNRRKVRKKSLTRAREKRISRHSEYYTDD